MKKIFTVCITFLTTLSLVGCAGMNNQDVGTLSGAAIGGLVGSRFGGGSGQLLATGAGVLLGAYIGGQMGRNMDELDRQRMYMALDENPVGAPAYWTNAHSGCTYTVIPVRNVVMPGYPYCREYRTTAIVAGRRQHIYGTACRQPDGSWRMMN